MPEYLRMTPREKISTFHQLPNELFWQAWQRFDQYRRSPHHGYSDVELLQFFYYGVRRNFQVELDVTGFWDFCAEYTQGAYSLCDDMAMAETEAQELYLMEEANNRRDIRFNTVEQEKINRSPYQESVYCDIEYPYYDQRYTPPSQYQNPSPQPLQSQTNLEDLQAMFLEAQKTMKKMQEEFVAIKRYSESQQGTLPMCTVEEEETERMDSELTVLGAEIAEETNLQPQTEHDELGEEVGVAESKEEVIVEAIQPPPVVEEKVIRKCGSTLQNKLATSFGDSTRLELSVKFEKTTFATSYYDSGSSLNWMTYATARSLGFTYNHFKDTELSLEFADQSQILALGILKGLAITVDNIPLQVDFAVLTLGEEFDDTIILGKSFGWVVRFIIYAQEENTDLHLGDNTTTSQEEIEMRANELETVEAESADEIDFPPTPECADTLAEDLISAECVETFKWDLGAAENKVVTPDFIEETSPIDAAPTPPSEQEEVIAFDEGTHPDQQGKELGNTKGWELCMETEDMSLAETRHDSSSAETENFSLTKTEDISLMKNQTEHGFCAEDILESAAMPRTGPDKPEDHVVSQFDKVVHHDIGDSLANVWSMSKKGNGFPWDDGISKELKLSDDPGLDERNFWVSNLLKPPLMFDHKSSGFLLKNRGTSAGIPRTGPDIPSFHEFDQSQFLRFAGEGGCITYCDVIGSVTRPPEVLLNVPVLC